MSNLQFHPPTKEVLKSKAISALCLMVIILGLYGTCYLLFFRTTDVNITEDIEISYRGENGSASVMIRSKNANYNQRISEFLGSVTYSVTPNENLKNGDEIRIEASYDKTLASRYHIDPAQTQKTILVSDLPIRYENAKKIPQTLLDVINKDSQTYMDKNMNAILTDDFTSFYVTSETKLDDFRRIYRVFLNAKDDANKDKIIDIYSITATGDVNTSNEGEQLERKQATIHYMITYNEINTSAKVTKDNIYGEKLITSLKQDLSNDAGFASYMAGKYGDLYNIERIE